MSLEMRKTIDKINNTINAYSDTSYPANGARFRIQRVISDIACARRWELADNYRDATLEMVVKAEKIQSLRLKASLKGSKVLAKMAREETIAALIGARNLLIASIG